jgi:hypothetical protein
MKPDLQMWGTSSDGPCGHPHEPLAASSNIGWTFVLLYATCLSLCCCAAPGPLTLWHTWHARRPISASMRPLLAVLPAWACLTCWPFLQSKFHHIHCQRTPFPSISLSCRQPVSTHGVSLTGCRACPTCEPILFQAISCKIFRHTHW